ncbi:MAG TPA: RluA family pseudouridine synthase [Candidatus Krumholzibacteria bacterium]|nr:RluA family pseudouridine synthase [Candidatus Krumholzibacteria bacterium]HRX50244.1 RluA family pseudouridine synthase [Candidatus Krumholzibacteria bacterium]
MPEAPALRTFTVDEDDRDARLDHFLTGRCDDLTRSRVQKAVAAGAALVDGRERPSRFRLTPGQTVTFAPPPPPPTDIPPEDLPLTVVHQDDDILVLNKAVGMVCHPAAGHRTGTLVNALLHRFRDLPGGDAMRPGLVHRLDKDTSGLMVVALTDRAHAHLGDQLRRRTLGRTYLALSWGQWNEDQGTLAGTMGRHPTQRLRMAVVSGGRRAVTHYEVEEDYGFVQLCRVSLETGRTHQIRVHFAAHGHPVVGDPLYGDDARVKQVHPLDLAAARRMVGGAARQMLHAARLELIHPADGRTLVFEAPPPADMADVLAGLHEELARRGGS